MKKFVFKFESIEKVRKIRENDALLSLARVQKDLSVAKQNKLDLENELSKSLNRQQALAAQLSLPAEYAIEDQFILGTKVRILYADRAIIKAERSVEKALKTFLDTRRKTRAIEILRERAVVDFKADMRKAELRELDDLMVMRSALKDEERESA